MTEDERINHTLIDSLPNLSPAERETLDRLMQSFLDRMIRTGPQIPLQILRAPIHPIKLPREPEDEA